MTSAPPGTPATDHAPLPLKGIRVLDMTRVLAGPYCALLLSEMGADVIKVEKPGRGDHYRRPRDGPLKAVPYQFLAWNSGKRSITLDTWLEEGKEVFRDLVRQSDVVLENFRPGVMEDMGLGYEALKEINPGIVMTSISGFGQGNSLSRYAAHAGVIAAFTGLIDVNQEGLKRAPGSSIDTMAGMLAAYGTAAALLGRQATGIGRHVDIAMTNVVLGQSAGGIMRDLLTGPSEARDTPPARAFPVAFHDVYRAKDGWFFIQADLEGEWMHLAEGMGQPELVTDPRFTTERLRGENKQEIDEIFNAWVCDKPMEEVFRLLGPLGVPCSPAHSTEEIAYHSYLRERGLVHDVEDPRAGMVPLVGPRILFVGEQPAAPEPAPDLGQQNDEIFGGLLGYDAAKLEALRKSEVI